MCRGPDHSKVASELHQIIPGTMKNLSIGLASLRHALGLAVLLSGFVSFACFGQTVTVRIVNAGDGTPVAAQKVLVSGVNGNGDTPDEARRKLIAKHLSPDATLVTDAQGRVRFDLPTAPPANFYVRAVLRPPVSSMESVTSREFSPATAWHTLLSRMDGRPCSSCWLVLQPLRVLLRE